MQKNLHISSKKTPSLRVRSPHWQWPIFSCKIKVSWIHF